MELPILFENETLVAVAKPAGVMTHPDGKAEGETVADWFSSRYPDAKDVGESLTNQAGETIAKPGIVHRLDRDTSGVLVLAKTSEAHAFLKSAFQNRDVHKTYLAFVYGVPKEKKGIIDFAIGRSRKDFRLRSAQPRARGTMREALTRYEVVGDIGTHSLIKAMPETGRTHQIRVHLKAIHHPVICDNLYAPNHSMDLGFSRLGLHAYSLDLPLPSGERTLITAPVPADFAAALPRFPGGDAFIASV
ncbi:MAG: RluA family pseudouridine synthase [Candidatus Pacebacteria bacterium]|nr:RluA family pseudouridine synthase [Candidatus Paceibacterota bacterium]MBP9840060.1 RluA family pseudouridine synthase [Candidatus Paceibacterota bacterium]